MNETQDIPLVLWGVQIHRAGQRYIRITTFISEDRGRVEHIVETGLTAGGPWAEARRFA